MLDELASATAVIFDMRGYPRDGTDQVVAHMIDEKVRSWETAIRIIQGEELP